MALELHDWLILALTLVVSSFWLLNRLEKRIASLNTHTATPTAPDADASPPGEDASPPDEDASPPVEFVCPITMELMRDPACASVASRFGAGFGRAVELGANADAGRAADGPRLTKSAATA